MTKLRAFAGMTLSCAVLAAPAFAQQPPCPQAWEVEPRALLGTWKAEFSGSWEGATLRLEAHPDYAQSFRGTLERSDARAEVAGDLDEGEFTLEESSDGKRIAATWLGDIVEGSCGREIRGTWTRDGDETSGRGFVLRRP
jgi:hypothetical protein